MAQIVIHSPSSPVEAAEKAGGRRRGASDSSDGSNASDIANIQALNINIEGEEGKSSRKGESSSRTASATSGQTTSSNASWGQSLRSLLGVSSAPGATPVASSQGQANFSANPQRPGLASAPIQSSRDAAPAVGASGSAPIRKSNTHLLAPPSTTARTAPQGIGGASGASINRGRSGMGDATKADDGEGGRLTIPSEIAPKRKKVVLEPGCSQLDWARLKMQLASQRASSPRGLGMARITPSQLKQHNKMDDIWMALNGKVYDVTPFMRFHPGGQKEMMRAAGRDGTRVFMLTHSWVNVDAMIDACCIGVLVSESS